MRIYLAGPVYGCSDSEAHAWRDIVRADHLGRTNELVDPMVRDYRGVELDNVEAIVTGDKADIDRCDAVLANCWQPSYGTAMEILYAHERNKIVVVVSDSGSPWLAAHAELVTPHLESALQYLSLWATNLLGSP